jgi:chromosome segregation ATPase
MRLQEIEGRIGALEEAKESLEKQLNAGAGDHRQQHSSAQQLAGTEEQLESLYRQWEQLAEEIAG